jgi:protein-tyrosine phosphatase
LPLTNIFNEHMKIVFICTGNICRSPSAESFLRHKLKQRQMNDAHTIDSAALTSYHIGAAPDPRAIKAGQMHGFDMSELAARQVSLSDFDRFDLIFALDRGHLDALNKMANDDQRKKIKLFNQYIHNVESDIEDPYYGSQRDFDQMLMELDIALNELIEKLF